MIDKVAATIRLQVHMSMVVSYQCTENSDTAFKAGWLFNDADLLSR